MKTLLLTTLLLCVSACGIPGQYRPISNNELYSRLASAKAELLECSAFKELAPKEHAYLEGMRHFVYFRTTREEICARAYIKGNQIMINTTYFDTEDCELTHTLKHELLHNAGLRHGPTFYTLEEECAGLSSEGW